MFTVTSGYDPGSASTWVGYDATPEGTIVPAIGSMDPPLFGKTRILQAMARPTAVTPTYAVIVETDVFIFEESTVFKITVYDGIIEASMNTNGSNTIGTYPVPHGPDIIGQRLRIDNISTDPTFASIVSNYPGTYTLSITPL